MARLQARNGGAPEPFDGIAELWFEAQRGPRSPEAAKAAQELLEDERNFIDLPNSPRGTARSGKSSPAPDLC